MLVGTLARVNRLLGPGLVASEPEETSSLPNPIPVSNATPVAQKPEVQLESVDLGEKIERDALDLELGEKIDRDGAEAEGEKTKKRDRITDIDVKKTRERMEDTDERPKKKKKKKRKGDAIDDLFAGLI
jgi:ribonuclease MRP protein subunit RMP1